MRPGVAGDASIEGALRALIHAVTAEVAEQMLKQGGPAKPIYATSKSNPLGSAETFLAAAANGKFKSAKVGRSVQALWSDVDAYVATLPAHRRLTDEASPSSAARTDEEERELDAMLYRAAFPKRPRSAEGFVYFVRSDRTGMVKIGFSRHVESRIRALRGAIGSGVTLLHHAPGTTGDERAAHRRFKSARREGEWFEPTTELMAHIEELRAEVKGAP